MTHSQGLQGSQRFDMTVSEIKINSNLVRKSEECMNVTNNL